MYALIKDLSYRSGFTSLNSVDALCSTEIRNKMDYVIRQNKLTDEVKKKIFQGFAHQAVKATGIDGLSEDPISFEIFGMVQFKPFLGNSRQTGSSRSCGRFFDS